MTSETPETPISPIEERYQETVRWSRNGQFDEAIQRHRELLQEDPSHIGCWGQIAYIHELKGEVDEAIDCYLRIVEMDPGLSIARLRLADCYFGKGDLGKAREAYLSLMGTPLFEDAEISRKLAQTESLPRKILRRSAPQAVGVLKKSFDPRFLVSLSGELFGALSSRNAIREVGVQSYLSYLSQHFLQGDWYRRPKAVCDLCGENDFQAVFYHQFQKVVRCRRCGLETVERKPDQGLDVFTDNYEKDDTVREFESLGWNDEQQQRDRIARIRSLFEASTDPFLPPESRIFEIGFGEGYLMKAFEDLGFRVSGIETSHRLVQYAHNELGLVAAKKTIQELREEDGPFEMIVAFHVLEHLDSPSLLLEKARLLLVEGGFLFIEIPVSDLAKMTLSKKLDPSIGYANIYHMSFFTPDTARRLFKKSGFDLVGEYTLYPDTHPTGGFLLKNLE